jgi:hypothetical protein
MLKKHLNKSNKLSKYFIIKTNLQFQNDNIFTFYAANNYINYYWSDNNWCKLLFVSIYIIMLFFNSKDIIWECYKIEDLVSFLLCENVLYGNKVISKNKIKIKSFKKFNIDFLNYEEISIICKQDDNR